MFDVGLMNAMKQKFQKKKQVYLDIYAYRMISQKRFIDFKLIFEFDNDLAVYYIEKDMDEKGKFV